MLLLELNYFFLIELIKKAESVSYTIQDAVEDVENINIRNDVCGIKEYFQGRIKNGGVYELMKMTKENVNQNYTKNNARPVNNCFC